MKDYDHKSIEAKWQKRWNESAAYTVANTVEGKENEYVLVEFPYPSGNLHVGHWYAFALPDIYVRFQKMQGKNVLYPIGFDAFGLPAENAAIKHGVNPREWTYKNMETMKAQLQSMGASFDWSREMATCDPAYYKWTQWLFLQLHKAGLVEKKTTTVNWDPVDKTVLANEQVLPDGTAERSGALVEQKEMEQWTIGITKYADRLIDDLDELAWPESIKDSQKNWIGRSEGARLSFAVAGSDHKIDVFTTRPDTLFGVTYLVLAPEHNLVQAFLEKVSNADEVQAYIEKTKRKTERDRLIGEKEKTGVQLEGVSAVHPATKEEVPIYIADYVLKGYGTGAIMAVPAHDERDKAFAEKFGLQIKKVIAPRCIDVNNPHVEGKEVVFRKGILAVVYDPKKEKYLTLRWPKQNWTTFVVGGVEGDEDSVAAAKREILEETGYKNVTFKRVLCGPTQSEFFAAHKDLNRVAHSELLLFELENDEQVEVTEEEKEKHTVHWVTRKELSTDMRHSEIEMILESLDSGKEKMFCGEGVLINSGEFNGLLSEDAKEKIAKAVGGDMQSTYKLRDWIVSRQRYWGCPIPMINCEKCGSVPVPEEQLPVELPDVDDYLPSDDGRSPLAKATEWKSAACPSCGAAAERETDTLDTFIDSSWYYLRYTDPNNKERFASEEVLKTWMPVDFYSGGAEHTTMHLLYSRFFHKALFDIGLVHDTEPYMYRQNRGLILGTDGNKMSKSKGNVIDPDKEVAQFGADTVRAYLAFIGPYNEPGSYPWDQNGIVGVRRFMERIAALPEYLKDETNPAIQKLLHETIKKVTEDTPRLKYNTAIAQLMTLTNAIMKEGISKADAALVAKIIAPFAPYVAEEVWEQLEQEGSVHQAVWPTYDASLLVSDMMTIAVQVNGKVRAQIEVAADTTEEEITKRALAHEQVQKWLENKAPNKVIYIPGKLLSVVV